jgi:chemotaxis protein CheZ
VQRKVFRIEQMMSKRRVPAGPQRDAPPAKPTGADLQNFERDLAAIYQAVEKSRQELAALSGTAIEGAPLCRAGSELHAAVGGMEKATQQILKVTESIDESARALSATLKDDYKRGLAQDIQDHVAQIFEACNFQDISGQRIAKARATLKFVEDRIRRVLEIWGGIDQFRRNATKAAGNGKMLNGPKLAGDDGHASQRDIDRLFA